MSANSDDEGESNDEDEDMEVGDGEQAVEAAKSSKAADFKDVADALKELDMDHYDDEDEGAICVLQICSVLRSGFGKIWILEWRAIVQFA